MSKATDYQKATLFAGHTGSESLGSHSNWDALSRLPGAVVGLSTPPPHYTAVVYLITFAFPTAYAEVDVVSIVDVTCKLYNVPNANLTFGYGVGEWGTEHCCTVKAATVRDGVALAIGLCQRFEQQCVYVEQDGRPFLVGRDGSLTTIDS